MSTRKEEQEQQQGEAAAAAAGGGGGEADVLEPTTASSFVHGKPYEGMCCLCTMEDITLEDGNYVEYQSHPSGIWQPALYERAIIEKLRHEQFDEFVQRVQTTDCQAELRRLLSKGPPVYLQDPHALPLAKPDTDTHVAKLWFAADNTEQSAKLKGALEGEDRDKLWDELRKFLIQEGKEEGDDDEDDANDDDDNNDGAADDKGVV